MEAVLCVGGQLEEAVALSYDKKHLILPRKKHHVSRLIVRFCHESLAHAGRGKPWRRRGKCSGYSEAEVWRRISLEIASSVAG